LTFSEGKESVVNDDLDPAKTLCEFDDALSISVGNALAILHTDTRIK
jgi:hypothetical protein